MKKTISIFTLFLTLVGCYENQEKSDTIENDGWFKDSKILKTIGNLHFSFPDAGYAYENKEKLIRQCFDAIDENIKLIGKTKFTDTIYVRFLSSQDEMYTYTGNRGFGNAYPYFKTIYLASNKETGDPPIQHELMHLVAMLDWDYPTRDCIWMNEGIATFSANECNGNNVAEIYRYLLEENRLISIKDLTSDFYGQSEMVGYHQSGYIVQYLLENYTIEQFKTLWTDGFEKFEEIYGAPYLKVKEDLEKVVLEKYPKVPEIDWETFNKGCK